ncbi:hypothetical protein KR009_004671 [Drosophila setifemur]|nr:hypothetical protein KR009_004671 [Drosophila setifemur]
MSKRLCKMVEAMGVDDDCDHVPEIKPEHEVEASKLWIHCNRCYEQFVPKKSGIILLACHHVCCEKCVNVCQGRTPSDAPIYMCPICHKNVRGREVSNSMPPTCKQLFHPEPWTMMNDFIGKFQRNNNRHYDNYKRKQEKIMDKVDNDIKLIESICKKRYLEMNHLALERKKYKQRLRQIKIQVAKRKEELRRIALEKEQQAMVKASQKSSSGYGTVQGRSTSQKSIPHIQKPNDVAGTSHSMAKRKRVTSFAYKSNHSFDL